MFNYQQFNKMDPDEYYMIAKAVWSLLLCDHKDSSPPLDFGSLLRELLRCCEEGKQARILLE